jgi:hypothetical protein
MLIYFVACHSRIRNRVVVTYLVVVAPYELSYQNKLSGRSTPITSHCAVSNKLLCQVIIPFPNRSGVGEDQTCREFADQEGGEPRQDDSHSMQFPDTRHEDGQRGCGTL